MNEIDLCADWKDKYQISLQNRARKYIYVEHLYDIILITRYQYNVSRFCVQDLCNRAHFPFRFDWMKTKSSAKKSSANAMVHITFFTEQCLLTWWALCLSISKVCYSKKNSNSIALCWRLHFGSEKEQNKSYSSFAAQAYYDIIKYQRIVETWQEVILS